MKSKWIVLMLVTALISGGAFFGRQQDYIPPLYVETPDDVPKSFHRLTTGEIRKFFVGNRIGRKDLKWPPPTEFRKNGTYTSHGLMANDVRYIIYSDMYCVAGMPIISRNGFSIWKCFFVFRDKRLQYFRTSVSGNINSTAVPISRFD